VLRGGKWGYIDQSGKLVISPQFEAADFFYEGLAAVRLNGQGGFVNTAGKMMIPPKFSSTGRFSDGVAAVFIDGKTPQERVYGYIDKGGELIIKCPFACGRAYSEGMMGEAVEVFRCVDELGMPVAKEYPCAPDANSKSHAILIDRWGYYDKSGKLAIPGIFHSGVGRFSEGVAAVQPYGARKVGYIDKSGAFVIPAQFDPGEPFCEGLAAVRVGSKWGFIRHDGKVVIEPQFDGTGCFSEEYAAVWLQGKAGYIDRTGLVVNVPRFRDAQPFSEGLAAVRCEKGKTGYIDTTGQWAIVATLPPRAMGAGPFSEGVALVDGESGAVYIDRSGKVIATVEQATGRLDVRPVY
jgi:hypothetical protein